MSHTTPSYNTNLICFAVVFAFFFFFFYFVFLLLIFICFLVVDVFYFVSSAKNKQIVCLQDKVSEVQKTGDKKADDLEKKVGRQRAADEES